MAFVRLVWLFLLTVSFSFLPFESKASKPFGFVKTLLFKTEQDLPSYLDKTEKKTDLDFIKEHSALNRIKDRQQSLEGCLTVHPHDYNPMMRHIAKANRIAINQTDDSNKIIAIQPHFSGLKGPTLRFMRSDLEQLALSPTKSVNEVYHNSNIGHGQRLKCDRRYKSEWDLELYHHIDLYDSDETPLVRSDIILNNRYHFGGYFVLTVSSRYNLYDNLEDEPDLRILDRQNPIRQDVLGFAWQGFNLNRFMLSGFVTPRPDTYVAAHVGYLEEMFHGFGGEILYRPFDKAFAIGGEVWRTQKRLPYGQSIYTVDDSNQQTSALINLWYDKPHSRWTYGLSAGRFLDGDYGFELRSLYKPASGWQAEAFTTFSTQSNKSLNQNRNTNFILGARLAMPLGQLRGLPANSKQIFDIQPFARDHGQRIDKAYPLYELTDAWQIQNIQDHWKELDSN
jgi:hypothetical protein